MPSVKLMESNKMLNAEEQATETTDVSEGAAGIEELNESSPTAAVDQQQPSGYNSTKAKEPLSPVQQMCLILEHKIRNLEKRKNKLDSYRALEQEGTKLSNDQKMAILKYDECVTSLELARELHKQFSPIATVATKDSKRQAKKNAFLKVQQENAKVRECLVILDVVGRFGDELVRNDFLNGTNGACQIAEMDLELIMMIYEQTKPKRPAKSTEKSFSITVRDAADVLSNIVDGKTKPFGSSNYAHAKSVLNSIQSCGYFDKDTIIVDESERQPLEEHQLDAVKTTECDTNNKETIIEVGSARASEVGPTHEESEPLIFTEAPAATAVPTPSFPMQINETNSSVSNSSTRPAALPLTNDQLSTASTIPIVNGNMQSATVLVPAAATNVPAIPTISSAIPHLATPPLAATTVQAVENAYFKQRYIQNHLRPLHEVLGNGNFFFLQDSEIDNPDIPQFHSTYVEVEHPITNIAMKTTATNELQQFQVGMDPHLAMPLKAPIQNTPHAQLTQNVIIPNRGVIGANGTFPNHIGLVNEPPIMNTQSFPAPVANQSNLTGLPNLPADANLQHALSNTNKIATNVKQPERNHIHGFSSSNVTTSPAFAGTHLQELGKLPSTAHASVQTNKSVGIVVSNDISEAHHPLHNITNPLVAPVSVVNEYGHIQAANIQFDNSMDSGVVGPLIMRPIDLHQSPKKHANEGALPVNESPKNDGNDQPGQNIANASYPLASASQSPMKRSIAKEATEERKEWVKGTGGSRNPANNDEQWLSSGVGASKSKLKMDDNVGRNNNQRVRPPGNGQMVGDGTGSIIPPTLPGKNNSNGGPANVKFISNSPTTPNSTSNVIHAQPSAKQYNVPAQPTGYRNNRSSNGQYSQNGSNNGRFNTENGATAGNPPTFFKNNERFYQNNYGPQRGGAMYKSRSENLGGNIGSRSNNNSAYSNTTAAALASDNSNGPGGISEYKHNQNTRTGTHARNNGPLGTRSHQRNGSSNLAYGSHPRGDSNTKSEAGANV